MSSTAHAYPPAAQHDAALEKAEKKKKKKDKKEKKEKRKHESIASDNDEAEETERSKRLKEEKKSDDDGTLSPSSNDEVSTAAPSDASPTASDSEIINTPKNNAITKVEEPTVLGPLLTQKDVDAFRAERHMAIVTRPGGQAAPAPFRSFSELDGIFPAEVMKKIHESGFPSPSPIQSQAWSIALSGRDMIGIAETGSGKTLAFILPAVVHIKKQTPLAYGETGPIALVLAPTRELAVQIQDEADKFLGSAPSNNGMTSGWGQSSKGFGKGKGFGKKGGFGNSAAGCGVRTLNLVGGMPKGPQIQKLKAGVELCISTPGRLIDLLEMDLYSCKFTLSRVSYLCLDEADRMLDMGFEKPLRKICSLIPRENNRQNLFFSATWPREVQQLARDLCTGKDPIQVNIGEGVGSGKLKANPRVTQHVEVLDRNKINVKDYKKKRLVEILKQEHDGEGLKENEIVASGVYKIVMFCKTKHGCDDLEWQINNELGYRNSAVAIHGDKDQPTRDWALNSFKKLDSGVNILVATDVAARGLDVKGVTCVINYDFPMNVEDYVHRIGRTGRAGLYGRSHSFFVPADLKNAQRSARELVKIMSEANQEIPAELGAIGGKGGFGGKGGKGGKGFGGKGFGGKGKGKGKGGFKGGFGGKGRW